MSVANELIKSLRNQFERSANSDDAEKMQSYMKSALPFYGIKSPALKKICRDAYKNYPLASSQEWEAAILAMYRQPSHREWRYAAIELLNSKSYRQFLTPKVLPVIEELVITGAWWDLVDAIAPHAVRYLLETYPAPLEKTLLAWAKGEDIWLRRSAILCQLRRKESTDEKLLSSVIIPSIPSEAFFLRKAIGWALRDYSYTNPNWVMAFLQNHPDLSKLSQREALKVIKKR